ncbi:lipoprotein [Fundicoccus sp. Sow4_D5]|uniref:lipoprotein n=1 Tax=unclassified Fundicoccus TaxID=2761543 RepID=UPI003F9029D9
MKKYILSLLSLVLLTGCQLFTEDAQTDSDSVETSSALVETETERVTVIEEDEETNAVNSLFKEEIIGQSDYPVSTSPDNIDPAQLLVAVEEYYLTNFSEEEQFANTPQVTDGALTNITDTIHSNEALAQLDVSVDQISMQLNGQTLYIPRIIVPMPYSESAQLVVENDVALFNSAITEVGNRLVMIAYYNPATDILTPMHVMNLSHSLFYYEPN